MKTHRFFVNQNLAVGTFECVELSLVHQIKDVLKLHVGEQVQLFDTNGTVAEATILELNKKTVVLDVASVNKHQPAETSVTLYAAILKSENFDLVVAKCTEVGVAAIVPLVTARTIKKDVNLTRLTKIAVEASEQSGRVFVPQINSPLKFSDALKKLSQDDVNIFCDISDAKFQPGDFGASKNISLFIGPEGGWTAEEREVAEKNGCLVRSLGKNVLRGETAAIVACFSACNQ